MRPFLNFMFSDKSTSTFSHCNLFQFKRIKLLKLQLLLSYLTFVIPPHLCDAWQMELPVLPVQCPWRLPATLSSTNRVRLSGVSGGRGVAPPLLLSVARLASELCSSLDRDGLRTSPEPEPLALPGTMTGPAAEGQEGGSSLSGLGGGNQRFFFTLKMINLSIKFSFCCDNNFNFWDFF